MTTGVLLFSLFTITRVLSVSTTVSTSIRTTTKNPENPEGLGFVFPTKRISLKKVTTNTMIGVLVPAAYDFSN